MLRLESIYWKNADSEKLKNKLEALGLTISPSEKDPQALAVDFGSETLTLFSGPDRLSTLDELSGGAGIGICGVALESDHVADEYRRLEKTLRGASVTGTNGAPAASSLGKPRQANLKKDQMPLWRGFSLPATSTPLLSAWVLGYSPAALQVQAQKKLPITLPNTCFGLEAVHLLSSQSETDARTWGKVLDKPVAGLKWNEKEKFSGFRIQLGEKFLDFLQDSSGHTEADSGTPRPAHGVFMITLRVEDLELAREIAQKAGANPQPCATRDGFIVGSDYTGGPALRFVRVAWKRYLPHVPANFPLGRRTDAFRPLGGANSTTLVQGFWDDWNH